MSLIIKVAGWYSLVCLTIFMVDTAVKSVADSCKQTRIASSLATLIYAPILFYIIKSLFN